MNMFTLVRITVVIVAVAALAGCQLRADLGLVVDEDGGGTIVVALETDEALSTRARDAGLDLAGQLALAANEIDGWTAEVDGERVELHTTAVDAAAMEATTQSFADAIATPELRPLEPVEVTLDERRVRLATSAGLVPTAAVGTLGYEQSEAEDLLRSSVRLTVSVEMPGEVVAHDADRVEGSRLVWDVGVGERTTITAESMLPQPRRWVPFGIVAAGATILAAIFVVGMRRRGR